MVKSLQHTVLDLMNLPLWAQFMLIGILIIVGQYWFSQIAVRLSGIKWGNSRMGNLIKYLAVSLLIAYLIVNFWLGTAPTGQRYEWGLYGRGAFISITLFLIQFFTRYFAR